MKKLINDTLKNPKTGEWSRKNLTGFACMLFSFAYVIYTTVADKEVHEFVVAIFVGAALTCLGISSWEKVYVPKNNSNSNDYSPHNPTISHLNNKINEP
jgi:hypothetical protein